MTLDPFLDATAAAARRRGVVTLSRCNRCRLYRPPVSPDVTLCHRCVREIDEAFGRPEPTDDDHLNQEGRSPAPVSGA